MTMNYRAVLARWPIRTIALTFLSYFLLQDLAHRTFLAFQEYETNPGWLFVVILGFWGIYSMLHMVRYLVGEFR
ncbi:hypothetical protein [Roseibium sp. RKSG952]|uniref:hypothetical protein n=1 Tax=Roseibium sp. RKSG952 TaxID=2529384 RepID=UPI0012BD65F5|nr:hypothetical protein [Roseibium sp. RKSG952]MTI00512.1 hypothetical protein [Roseibium sp. RKSG952]